MILRKLHDRKYGAEGLFDLHKFTQRNPDVSRASGSDAIMRGAMQ